MKGSAAVTDKPAGPAVRNHTPDTKRTNRPRRRHGRHADPCPTMCVYVSVLCQLSQNKKGQTTRTTTNNIIPHALTRKDRVAAEPQPLHGRLIARVSILAGPDARPVRAPVPPQEARVRQRGALQPHLHAAADVWDDLLEGRPEDLAALGLERRVFGGAPLEAVVEGEGLVARCFVVWYFGGCGVFGGVRSCAGLYTFQNNKKHKHTQSRKCAHRCRRGWCGSLQGPERDRGGRESRR